MAPPFEFGQQFLIDVLPADDPWDTPVRSAEWKDSVIKQLMKISHSKAGIALLNSIRAGNQPIMVVPPLRPECSAHGFAVRTVRKGKMYQGAAIYDPSVYMRPSACFIKKHLDQPNSNRGVLPDEVFFHELIHAHRGALRIHNPVDLHAGLYRYTNEEEFIAVVITNVYISDVTNPHSSGLRRDHTHFYPLESKLSTSLTFYKSSPQVLPLIKKFAAQEPFLFGDLAKVKTRFNPFAALTECEKALKVLSNSQLANQREVAGMVAQIVKEAGSEASQILAAFGLAPNGTKTVPTPDLAKLAKETLDPLAQEALRVLRR